ncbi:MAG: hypothetical protein US96_C0036G0007 [Candidatus Woesebacteria bacterium GW2011_GWB1_38_5b]|uniref:Transport permease protein n=1 Tax=Candidatus Woesebacteria bacterium GW2011_GWB1_38_5b TaxID=1618569 RepID=A0A0G0KFM5_9BACT|nr:MAG: hypothetical protein US96_C0036G0007 [Candidatus Woesebacteria bacterium GW2011_GWB1_38_5b]
MEFPRSLRNFFWLLYILTLRELKGRYKSAALGFAWAFINPLLFLLVLSVVFSLFIKIDIENYQFFLLSGILPWTFFAAAISSGTSSLVNNRELIKKTYFRREAIPLASVLASLLNFLISLLIFIGLFIILKFSISSGAYLLPLAILLEAILITGIVLLTSSLDIYYRDVTFIISAAVLIWFYLTPIFYPINFVPEKFLFAYKLNPMVGIISLYRTLLLGANYFDIEAILISVAETFVFIIIGFAVFKKREKYFADWI